MERYNFLQATDTLLPECLLRFLFVDFLEWGCGGRGKKSELSPRQNEGRG